MKICIKIQCFTISLQLKCFIIKHKLVVVNVNEDMEKSSFLYMVSGKSLKPLCKAVLKGPQKMNTDLPFLRIYPKGLNLEIFT